MRIVFAGTPAFSLPCLQGLLAAGDMEVAGVVSQPDRKAGRGMKLTPSPIKQTALDHGIDAITPDTLRHNAEALAWLQDKQADFLVVVAFGMLLPKTWLDASEYGAINVHASLLPRWRGAAPIERALLAGDDETGVCIMHMDEGLDTGGVYACRRLAIRSDTTGTTLRDTLSVLGAALLVETLPDIAAGHLKAVPQDEALATYAAKLTNEERIIDWALPADVTERIVRTFAPKPGARTQLQGKWLKILAGEVLEIRMDRTAGTITGNGSALDVICGDRAVYRVLEVQPEGKQAMLAEAFLRGVQLKPGDRLA